MDFTAPWRASIIKFGPGGHDQAQRSARPAGAEGPAVEVLHQPARLDQHLVDREPKTALFFEISEVKRDVVRAQSRAYRRVRQVTTVARQVRNRLSDFLPALPHDLL